MSCPKCSKLAEFPEEGNLIVESTTPQLILAIIENCQKFKNVFKSDYKIKFSYTSLKELQQLVNEMDEMLSVEAKQVIFCRCENKIESELENQFISTTLAEFIERVNNLNYLKIINEKLYTSFIQPIVSLENLSLYGYEFLLRPKEIPFNPEELFQFSQKAGLQSLLDSQARILSIEKSAELLAKGVKRFINFLPSSIYDPDHCLKTTFIAAERYKVDPRDLIFEVVETEKIENIDHLKKIFDVYKKNGIKVALDDLGSGYATTELLKALKPNFAKIDRAIISHCDFDNEKQDKLTEWVNIAEENGIFLLAEGIERKEEAQFCKDIGIPLAQGYFFSRPQPHPTTISKFTI
ncbi:EAL domain-containing protein [Bacillaceae bacterium IKA-2]|nr:EAL domain-containing protein [Bacillaceae bacterium IKA-2]